MIASVNPYDGVTVKTFEPVSDRELDYRLDLAQRAFLRQRQTSFADRAGKLLKAAEILESEKSRFA